jgi:hypothetical protein
LLFVISSVEEEGGRGANTHKRDVMLLTVSSCLS